jgi:hypothetical protein
MNLTFSQALEHVKNGIPMQRAGWNGKGMFIFMRPEAEITIDDIVHKVVSVPQKVKDFFAQKTNPHLENRVDGDTKVKFTAYLCMYAADGSIVNGWLASQTDMLANDWQTA